MTNEELMDLLVKQNAELIAQNGKALSLIQQVLDSKQQFSYSVDEGLEPETYTSMDENEDDKDGEMIPGEIYLLEDLIETAERELTNELSEG